MNERRFFVVLAALLGVARAAHAGPATDQLGCIDDANPVRGAQAGGDAHVASCRETALAEANARASVGVHERKSAADAEYVTIAGGIGGVLVIPGALIVGAMSGAIAGGRATAIGGAVVGGVLGTIAAAWLPSAGPHAAGTRWTAGFAVRTVGAAATAYALATFYSCMAEESDDDGCNLTTLEAVGLGGLVGYVIGVGLDVSYAGDAARSWNRRIVAAPTVVDGAPGLSLAGSF
jgi:hypothetical protein